MAGFWTGTEDLFFFSMNIPADPYSPHRFSKEEKTKKSLVIQMKEAEGQTRALTFDHSAQQARDGLDLRHLVQVEVIIACGIGTGTEDVPQVGGHTHVPDQLGLIAGFKVVICQSSVSHEADSENGDEERDGADEALQVNFI